MDKEKLKQIVDIICDVDDRCSTVSCEECKFKDIDPVVCFRYRLADALLEQAAVQIQPKPTEMIISKGYFAKLKKKANKYDKLRKKKGEIYGK